MNISRNVSKYISNHKAFSLIELMVVIAIIAILAVIGITIFSGAQRGARDAQRRADMNNFIKSLETKKPSTSNYGGLALAATDFSTNSLPQDPSGTTIYCASPTTGATTASAVPGSNWTTTCPTGYVSVNNTAYTAPTNATQVRVCSWLERDNAVFCRVTAQ